MLLWEDSSKNENEYMIFRNPQLKQSPDHSTLSVKLEGQAVAKV